MENQLLLELSERYQSGIVFNNRIRMRVENKNDLKYLRFQLGVALKDLEKVDELWVILDKDNIRFSDVVDVIYQCIKGKKGKCLIKSIIV